MDTLSYGLEIELPVIKKDGQTWRADRYLEDLSKIWSEKNYSIHESTNQGQILEISHSLSKTAKDPLIPEPKTVAGYDCVYHTLELATGPYDNLQALYQDTAQVYNEVLNVAQANDAYVLNFSELPNYEASVENYMKMRLPKALYKYFYDIRGLRHNIGTDAKSQLSPCLGIKPEDAISALNLMIKLSPVFIALFGNSPYEAGQDKHVVENRLSIWQQFFSTSIYCGDYMHFTPPEGFFKSWQHYFHWMYNRIAPAYSFSKEKDGSYKSGKELYYIPAAPNMISYLKEDSWAAVNVENGQSQIIRPHFQDIVAQQYTLFCDARLRFAFVNTDLDIKAFLKAFESSPAYFQDYITEHLRCCYIESRPAGSNCPDFDLKSQGVNKEVLDSTHVALIALQAGLVRNYQEVESYLKQNNYEQKYMFYRQASALSGIRADFQGNYQLRSEKIIDFIRDLIIIAKKALDKSEQKFLAFVEYNLETQTCGADRARSIIQTYSSEELIDWSKVYEQRAAIKIGE